MTSAQAQLRIAQDQLGYTVCCAADAAGAITAVGAEAGELVRAGQMIVKVAREDQKDALFEVAGPAGIIATPVRIPSSIARPTTRISRPLAESGSCARRPVTRLFPVKVGLDSSPLEFFLGGMVRGRSFDTPPIMTLPLTAVIEATASRPFGWSIQPAIRSRCVR